MNNIVVIPARGNSKGVYKKNLRILNGKPLLYYAIKNGLQISDTVIVTSEDDQILEYAKFMGATPHKRDLNLSQDNTTLDPVIEDAVRYELCDYVITLQPTSPTLKHKSILCALKKMETEKLDWIVSVEDCTHIHHIKNMDQVRVNRQYMDKMFKETGGFQICKRENLKGSRFTGKGSFYELSQEESVDIDTDTDFLLADAILNKLRINIVYTFGHKQGSGHKKRARLLQSLFTGHDIKLYDVEEIDDHYDDCDLLILDVLDINQFCSKISPFIVTLENLGKFRGNLTINGIYPEEFNDNSEHGDEQITYSGWKYMTINDSLVMKDCFNPNGKTIVCFGGTDPNNFTQNYDPRYYDVYSPLNPRPIQWEETKLVITSAGNVAYEATARNLPVVCITQNDREKKHEILQFDNVAIDEQSALQRLNQLHENAKKYDFQFNNKKLKDFILSRFYSRKYNR